MPAGHSAPEAAKETEWEGQDSGKLIQHWGLWNTINLGLAKPTEYWQVRVLILPVTDCRKHFHREKWAISEQIAYCYLRSQAASTPGPAKGQISVKKRGFRRDLIHVEMNRLLGSEGQLEHNYPSLCTLPREAWLRRNTRGSSCSLGKGSELKGVESTEWSKLKRIPEEHLHLKG